ncbi:hypothetical protein AB4305_03565 [Nocardia sp. 2YAB30]|uniref:hypothetical protein n=1 Tax=unclassified Nocardia TaxID=2637762 RepID=UPI003F99930F
MAELECEHQSRADRSDQGRPGSNDAAQTQRPKDEGLQPRGRTPDGETGPSSSHGNDAERPRLQHEEQSTAADKTPAQKGSGAEPSAVSADRERASGDIADQIKRAIGGQDSPLRPDLEHTRDSSQNPETDPKAVAKTVGEVVGQARDAARAAYDIVTGPVPHYQGDNLAMAVAAGALDADLALSREMHGRVIDAVTNAAMGPYGPVIKGFEASKAAKEKAQALKDAGVSGEERARVAVTEAIKQLPYLSDAAKVADQETLAEDAFKAGDVQGGVNHALQAAGQIGIVVGEYIAFHETTSGGAPKGAGSATDIAASKIEGAAKPTEVRSAAPKEAPMRPPVENPTVPRGMSLNEIREGPSRQRYYPTSTEPVAKQPGVDWVDGIRDEWYSQKINAKTGDPVITHTIEGGQWISAKRLAEHAGTPLDKRLENNVDAAFKKFETTVKNMESSRSITMTDGSKLTTILKNPNSLLIHLEVEKFDSMPLAQQEALQTAAERAAVGWTEPGEIKEVPVRTFEGLPVSVKVVEAPDPAQGQQVRVDSSVSGPRVQVDSPVSEEVGAREVDHGGSGQQHRLAAVRDDRK